jgi:hypothetical protein
MVVLPIILAHMVATGKDQRLQKIFLWPHRSFSVARSLAHSRTSPLPVHTENAVVADLLILGRPQRWRIVSAERSALLSSDIFIQP